MGKKIINTKPEIFIFLTDINGEKNNKYKTRKNIIIEAKSFKVKLLLKSNMILYLFFLIITILITIINK